MARQNGFPSYDAMVLWAQQRNQQSGGTIQGQGKRPLPMTTEQQVAQERQKRAQNSGLSGILQYIGDALGGRL
jgi:hypothetical protein